MNYQDLSLTELTAEIALLRSRNSELEQIIAQGTQSLQGPDDEQVIITSLMRNLPGMAYRCRVDRDWTMEYVSEGCFDLTGYHPLELLQNRKISYEGLTHPDDRPFVRQMIGIALQQRQPFRCCYRIMMSAGEEKWVLERGNGIFSPQGEAIALAGLIIDINEQKQAEQALEISELQLRQQTHHLQQTLTELQQTQAQLVQTEKMSSLGQLVAGIAHEINNPINFIHGNLAHANEYIQDLLGLVNLYQTELQTTPAIETRMAEVDLLFLAEDLPKLLASMQVGTERIRGIVQSLRNFSRIDEPDAKAVDLREGLDSTLMILGHRLRAKSDSPGIQVLRDYGELPLINCYPGQLNQVFMNILSNAIDALEEHHREHSDAVVTPGKIWIQTEKTTEHAIIRIKDNGPGITQAVQKQLFDPFFTTKPVGKGTGLGLSISYQIITEKHGGSLECISAPGQGTEFMIKIPL